mgnify:CR=1 FL=1
MEALICNFRMGRHTKYGNHMILAVPGVDTKEKALTYLTKKVAWKSPAGKEIKGEIVAAHGSKGRLRAIFETGMPGQAVASQVVVS